MPPRKKVALLPKAIREELNARLIEGAFSDYRGLVAWLKSKGCEIGRSALQEYGGDLEREIEQVRIATEQAESFLASTPDNESALADSGIRFIQMRIHQALRASQEDDPVKLARVMRALVEGVRATLSLRKDQRNVRDETGKAAEAAAKRTGASSETIAAIRAVYQGAAAEDSQQETS